MLQDNSMCKRNAQRVVTSEEGVENRHKSRVLQER